MELLLAFMKKDLLHLLRDKKETMLLTLMPFLLITILGFALGGLMKEEKGLNVGVGVVDHGDFTEQIKLFEEWLIDQPIPEEARIQVLEAAKQASLPELLVEGVMEGELADLFTVTEEERLSNTLDSDFYAAVLYFPENYRLESWKQQFFGADSESLDIELYLNEENGVEAKIVLDIVENFIDQMRLYTVLSKASNQASDAPPDFSAISTIHRETVALEGKEPINSFQYFSIGMSVMFALYVVSFVAGYAFQEKKSFVYDRILLANTSSWIYGASKWISGVLVSFIQLCVLFGLCGLFYKVHWPDIASFFIITFMFSLVVGSITVLITALNFRFDTERVTNMFSGFLVSVLAFLGGSFMPWNSLSDTLWKIGSYTPNGAALQSYLHVLQGGALKEVLDAMIILAIMSILLLLFAIALFPNRRVMS